MTTEPFVRPACLPQVAMFRRVSAGSQRWAFLEARRPHTHDVRAAAVVTPPGSDPLLVTAGHDSVLLVHSVPRFQKVASHSPSSAAHDILHSLGKMGHLEMPVHHRSDVQFQVQKCVTQH